MSNLHQATNNITSKTIPTQALRKPSSQTPPIDPPLAINITLHIDLLAPHTYPGSSEYPRPRRPSHLEHICRSSDGQARPFSSTHRRLLRVASPGPQALLHSTHDRHPERVGFPVHKRVGRSRCTNKRNQEGSSRKK